jgi:hypothetical protein
MKVYFLIVVIIIKHAKKLTRFSELQGGEACSIEISKLNVYLASISFDNVDDKIDIFQRRDLAVINLPPSKCDFNQWTPLSANSSPDPTKIYESCNGNRGTK